MTSSGNSNRLAVDTASAKAKMDNMKYEVASQLGVNLKQGYNGDISAREAGSVGGQMVKKNVTRTK